MTELNSHWENRAEHTISNIDSITKKQIDYF